MHAISNSKSAWLGLVSALALCCSATAQITVDGTTDTTTSTDASGTVTVGIAPTIGSGVSLNRFTDFNIDENGVILDNTSVAASTIVNEVTSTNVSALNGALTVDGQRAHVIIANPNGITVDGVTFENTGGVALATASVTTDIVPIAPGIDQTDLILTTSAGPLKIEGAGLSAAATTLMLLSESIYVDGQISNVSDVVSTQTDFYAGSGTVKLDSSVVPADDARAWATFTPTPVPDGGTPDLSKDGVVIVDITPLANITSGSISIVVGPTGAGVRSHGTMAAYNSNLNITSTGKVELQNSARALDSVNITAKSLEVGSEAIDNEEQQTVIEAQGGTLNLDITEDVTVKGAQLVGGGQQDLQDGVNLEIGGDLTLETTSAQRLAIVFSKVGDANIDVEGSISNTYGRFISNYHMVIDAEGDFTNEVTGGTLADGQEMAGTTSIKVYGPFSFGSGQASVNYGNLDIENQLAYVIASGDLTLDAKTVKNHGGEIHAREGDLTINADSLENRAVLTGRGDFKVRCYFLCRAKGSSSSQQTGGTLTASAKVDLNLTGDLIHAGTLIRGAEGIEIDANDVKAISSYVTNTITRPGGMGNLFEDQGWTYSSSAGGLIESGESITINATASLNFEEAQLVVGDEGTIDIPNGYALVQVPVSEAPTSGLNLGVFAWFLVPIEDVLGKW